MYKEKTALIALVAVLLTAGVLWYTNRADIPRQATWDDVLAEAKVGGYRLISTEELSQRYEKDAGAFLLVDTRQEWEYRTGHITGAVNFPMEPTAWTRWRRASALESFLGPDKDRPIVFY